jgi:hypothetical protein
MKNDLDALMTSYPNLYYYGRGGASEKRKIKVLNPISSTYLILATADLDKTEHFLWLRSISLQSFKCTPLSH